MPSIHSWGPNSVSTTQRRAWCVALLVLFLVSSTLIYYGFECIKWFISAVTWPFVSWCYVIHIPALSSRQVWALTSWQCSHLMHHDWCNLFNSLCFSTQPSSLCWWICFCSWQGYQKHFDAQSLFLKLYFNFIFNIFRPVVLPLNPQPMALILLCNKLSSFHLRHFTVSELSCLTGKWKIKEKSHGEKVFWLRTKQHIDVSCRPKVDHTTWQCQKQQTVKLNGHRLRTH